MRKFAIVVAALALIVTAGTAHAGIGATMEYNGSFDPRIGINFGNAGSTIDLLAGFNSIDGFGNVIVVGGRFEKLMTGGGNASPLFGLCADVALGSPDEGDSFTDFAVGGFLGGRVEIVEDFSIAGHMGFKANINGARAEGFDSTTDFGTFVNVAIRLTNLWGSK
jgi:hypothetical protein